MFSETNEVVVDVTLFNYETQEYRLWVNFQGIAKDSGNAYYGEVGRNQALEDAKMVFEMLNSLAPYVELRK